MRRGWFVMGFVVALSLAGCQTGAGDKEAAGSGEESTGVSAEQARAEQARADDDDAARLEAEAVAVRKIALDSATTAIDRARAAALAAASAAARMQVAPDGTVMRDCVGELEGMSCIPGGPFIRGVDDDTERYAECKQSSHNNRKVPNSTPASTVWQQTFYMDIEEVTYGDYEACVEADACGKGVTLYRDFKRDWMPKTGLSWFDAVDYCTWKGKHLPTEAEWEKAARGPDGELFPWGNEPATCERAVIMDERGRSCGIPMESDKYPDKGRLQKPCSKGASRYGLCDMIGNAEEWVADWYTHSWEDCGEACQGVDPKGPCDGAVDCERRRLRLVRGGSWYWPAPCASSLNRRSHVPDNPNENYHHFGFRCAASLDEARALVGAQSPDTSTR